MRVFFAILISLLLIGGTFAYTKFAESVRPEPLEIKENFAQQDYHIQIFRTFDSEGDPDFDVASISVLFRGETIFESTEPIPATEVIEIKSLSNVVVEGNEVFVTANVKSNDDDWDSEPKMQQAMRIVILEGESIIAENSFWLDPGNDSVAGTVSFKAQSHSEDHDH